MKKSRRGMKRVCFWTKTTKKTKRRRRKSMKRAADASFKLGNKYDYYNPSEQFRY